MILVQVTKNIFVPSDDSNLGEIDEISKNIFKIVQNNFSNWLGLDTTKTKSIIVLYNKNYPMTEDIEKYRLIRLCLKLNQYCLLTYQFSHEYCHHLINGIFSGEIRGLKWFEEVLCHLASFCQLRTIITNNFKEENAGIGIFFKNCYNRNHGVAIKNNDCKNYIDRTSYLLNQNKYHRKIYDNISTTMEPLFIENPNLWKIILNIGDSLKWCSLDELFDTLQSNADESFSSSLSKLRKLICS